MGTAVRCVLAVHKREIGLAVVPGVGECNLYLVAAEIDNIVLNVLADLALQKVVQSFVGIEGLLVEGECEPLVQVGVVPQPLLHKVEVEGIFPEKLFVRHKFDEHAVPLLGA